MLYVDTSVIVAYYCPEPLSDKVEKILIKTQNPAISQLTELEFTSALARKIREKSLAQDDGRKILSLFQTHLEQKSYIRLPFQPKHYAQAKDWLSQFKTPLRTLDALHLAIAAGHDLPIITADEKLASSAGILGVKANLIG